MQSTITCAASAGVNVIAVGSTVSGKLRRNFPETVLPTAMTLTPELAAQVIVDCIEGRRDADRGQCIIVKK